MILSAYNLSFKSSKYSVPTKISDKYLTSESKANTVTILAASRDPQEPNPLEKYMDMCSSFTKSLIQADKNILTGCATTGIMGAAYNTAVQYSQKDETGRPIQNLAVTNNPLWGNENLDDCVPVVSSNSAAEGAQRFMDMSDTIVVFPGSVTTLLEASTIIQKNYYGNPEEKRNVILVGKDYYKGLIEQYETMHKSGLINCKPEELFTVVDSLEELENKVLK